MKRRVIGKATAQGYESLAEGIPSLLDGVLEARTPPGTKGTDRIMMHGANHNPCPGMAPWEAAVYINQAKAAGIDISGKQYKSKLADKRRGADPMAWVGGTDDIVRVAKKRNLNISGCVEHRAVDLPPPPPIRLAEDIVHNEMKRELRADPSQAKNLRELREKVIEKHGAPK